MDAVVAVITKESLLVDAMALCQLRLARHFNVEPEQVFCRLAFVEGRATPQFRIEWPDESWVDRNCVAAALEMTWREAKALLVERLADLDSRRADGYPQA